MKVDFVNRLSFRQARNAFLIGILLGVVTSSLQIRTDIIKERKRLDVTITQMIDTIRGPAAQSAYDLDILQAKRIVSGLFEYPSIRVAKVMDNFGKVLASESRPAASGQLHWLVTKLFGKGKDFKILLSYGQSEEYVGSLNISLDMYAIGKDFIDRVGMVVVGDIVRNIILACILASLFYYSLTLPLQNIAKNLTEMDFSDPTKGQLEIPRRHKNDELGLLIKTFNRMTEDLKKSTVSINVLQEEQKRFKDVAESTGDWIWEVDNEGRYIYSSPGVEKVLGYKPEEALGKYFYDFFHPDDRDQLKKAAFEVFSRKEIFQNFLNRNIHKDGHIVVIETTGVPIISQDGKFLGYRGVDRDITERKKAEEQQSLLMRDLEQTNKIMTGRELRMIELKEEINKLNEELGRPAPYGLSSIE